MICVGCGKEFTPKYNRRHRLQRYCTQHCRQGFTPEMTKAQFAMYRKLRWRGGEMSQAEAVKAVLS